MSAAGFRAEDGDLTPRALYLLMQQRFQDNSTAVLAALTAQKEAVDKAEKSAKESFDEFKREIGEKLDTFGKKLDDLARASNSGTGGGIARREIIAYLIAIASIAATLWKYTGH